MAWKSWSGWLVAAVFVASGARLCAEQASPPAHFRHQTTWNFDFIQLPKPEGSLLVDLGELTGVSDWILEVKADNERPRLVAGEASYMEPPPDKRLPGRVVERIRNLPRGNLEISRGRVALRGVVGSGGPLILLIWAPAGTNVTVRSSAGVVATLPVGDGFMLHNGKVVAKPATVLGYLLQLGMPPEVKQAKGDVVTLPGNRYVATVAGLKSHLIRYELPSESLRLAPGTGNVPVTLSIEINESGAVDAIHARPGGEAVLTYYEPFIRKWRFRPFVVDGRPVRVKAALAFVVAPSGTVTGPIGFVGAGQLGPGEPRAGSCCDRK